MGPEEDKAILYRFDLGIEVLSGNLTPHYDSYLMDGHISPEGVVPVGILTMNFITLPSRRIVLPMLEMFVNDSYLSHEDVPLHLKKIYIPMSQEIIAHQEGIWGPRSRQSEYLPSEVQTMAYATTQGIPLAVGLFSVSEGTIATPQNTAFSIYHLQGIRTRTVMAFMQEAEKELGIDSYGLKY